ncbi:MAG TPA: penicillin acylase family protein [Dermatophilaceae bacterium]|nr:penicillin acylase family protein [Dermatophilaceae bacterium]
MTSILSRRGRLAAASAVAGLALATLPITANAADTRSGPPGTVTIKRDTYGIPHVYALTTHDLFRGYGYVVGEDRLFQMEMSRRTTQGTVSEVLGSAFVALDKDTRNGSDPDSIRAQLAALPQQDRDIFEGYAAGLNEYLDRIATDPGRLMPKQFLDYGFAPSRWTAYDVAMVWVGTMAYRYSDSSTEIPNYAVLQTLLAAYGPDRGRALFDMLVWREDPLAPTTVPRTGAVTTPGNSPGPRGLSPITPGLRDSAVEMMQRAGGGTWPNMQPQASNVWITGKDRTIGAKSVLVNGPQFQWFNPSYVFGIGLHGAGYDFAGNTPFAYPSVIFGTNSEISWGATAGPMNLVDMYQERLNPANPRQYLYDGAYRDMVVRTEIIPVKDAPAVTVELLRTVHGPVTSVDLPNATAYSKRRSFAGAEVQSLVAWAKLPKAKNFAEFRDLAAQFAISINWYYADKKGNIGYISPGRLPDRPAHQDIRLPAIGDGSMEWSGFLPATANPLAYNPAQGFVANWNNQAGPGFNNDYGNWSVVDRDQEILAELSTGKSYTPEQLWELNERFSFVDLNLRYLAPTLRAAVATRAADDPVRRDVELLTTWSGETRDGNGDGVYDGPQPTIMRAWLPLLAKAVLSDDLPASIFANYTAGMYLATPVETRASIRPAQATKLIYNAILGGSAGVRQSIDLFNGLAPGDVLLATYQQALDQLRASKGVDPTGWTTPISRMAYSYRNFLGVPQAAPSEQLLGPQYMNRGTENNMAVLGAGADRLCLVAPPGQSGFVAPDGTKSPHYDDQLALYASFGCRDEHLTQREVSEATVSTTVLR